MSSSFSAWKEGAPKYVPALTFTVIFAALVYSRPHVIPAWAGLILFGAYGLFSLAFFRDPPRGIPGVENDVVSPADGKVVAIEDLDDTAHYAGPCRRVSIFMSPFNAHVNRAPVQGVVSKVLYKTGRYTNAGKPAASKINESNAVWFDTAHGPVTVRQISGAIARRIVCRVAIGDILARGQKFGMIKFGSRSELYLPPGTQILANISDKVYAGSTIIARFEG